MIRNPSNQSLSIAKAGVLAMTALCALPSGGAAGTIAVLHAFRFSTGGLPTGSLVSDGAGNLYGTTGTGGATLGGTVFKIAPDGKQTVLYSFCNGDNCPAGNGPSAGVVRDSAGNLYGVTAYGGAAADGVVFRIAPDGSETVVHKFTGGSDGEEPVGTLVRDGKGNLFGTTLLGGSTGCGQYGCGTVFRIAPDGSETVLYVFTGGSDGAWPYAGLVADGAGNLYGTASYGGSDNDGVVFQLTKHGAETVLHSFSGGDDGRTPVAPLYRDAAGNLDGTTDNGGRYGKGIVFALAPNGSEKVLHAFAGAADGANPDGALSVDHNGRLFGTTERGGKGRCGTIFEIAPSGAKRVLYDFHGRSDGDRPVGRLTLRDGIIYGVTELGGAHKEGEVFALQK